MNEPITIIFTSLFIFAMLVTVSSWSTERSDNSFNGIVILQDNESDRIKFSPYYASGEKHNLGKYILESGYIQSSHYCDLRHNL